VNFTNSSVLIIKMQRAVRFQPSQQKCNLPKAIPEHAVIIHLIV